MILIRRDGESWRSPSIRSLGDESALQTLLAESPQLLPGVETPVAVAQEMDIPGAGRADLVMVDSTAAVTLVECKLRTNPEIRRAVIGQILGYAAGLWGTSYHSFADRFERTAETALHDLIGSSRAGDLGEFERALEDNLHDGRLRLIVAVDEITEELRQTISFLNGMTRPEVEVLAVELGYVRDGDVEIVVPQTYGVESSNAKARQSGRKWTEGDFRAQIAKVCSAHEVAAVDRMLGHAAEHGTGKIYWGEGIFPAATAWYPVDDTACATWSIYTRDDWASFDINFQWIIQRGIPEDRLQALLARLRKLEPFRRGLDGVVEAGFMRRPGFPIGESIGQPEVLEGFLAALDEMLGIPNHEDES